MTGTVTADLTGLNRFMSELFGALLGAGRGGDGDAQRFVRIQAGLLAQEISNELGPSSQSSAARGIAKDARKYLTIMPVYTNFDENQSFSKKSDWEWLSAGPVFLLGIDQDDLQIGLSGSDALAVLRYEQKSLPQNVRLPRGQTYLDIGMRGRQRVMKLNRIKITPAAFSGMVRAISKRVGILKASFAWSAQKLLRHVKAPPKWVLPNMANQAQGRAIFNDAGLDDQTSPWIEFGSRAPGVTSNPYISGKIHNSIERRKHIMLATMNKIVSGYTYDWNTGRVFKPKVTEEESE